MRTMRVADVVTQVRERELHDAVGVGGAGARRVLALGDPEEDDRADPEVGQLGHLLAERLTRVLHDAGERADRLRDR